MYEDFEINRDAVVEVFRQQNREALQAAVARGEWTQREADLAHQTFMASAVLQTLVDENIAWVLATLHGQVH